MLYFVIPAEFYHRRQAAPPAASRTVGGAEGGRRVGDFQADQVGASGRGFYRRRTDRCDAADSRTTSSSMRRVVSVWMKYRRSAKQRKRAHLHFSGQRTCTAARRPSHRHHSQNKPGFAARVRLRGGGSPGIPKEK